MYGYAHNSICKLIHFFVTRKKKTKTKSAYVLHIVEAHPKIMFEIQSSFQFHSVQIEHHQD